MSTLSDSEGNPQFWLAEEEGSSSVREGTVSSFSKLPGSLLGDDSEQIRRLSIDSYSCSLDVLRLLRTSPHVI